MILKIDLVYRNVPLAVFLKGMYTKISKCLNI